MSKFVFKRISKRAAVLSIIVMAGAVAWADGQRDTAWGTSGNAHVSFPNNTNDTLSAALKQADGTYLVAGVDPGPNNGNGGQAVYIAQLNASGVVSGTPVTQDVSTLFPSSGTNSGGASSATIPTDGKILVAGGGANTVGFYGVVTRLNLNGTTEATFTRPNAAGDESGCVRALSESPTGKVTVACIAGNSTTNVTNAMVLRLNNDLTPDTSFGTGGVVKITAMPTAAPAYTRSGVSDNLNDTFPIAKDANGNYFVLVEATDNTNNCGSQASSACNTALYVVKLNSAGQLDTTFGSNGTAVVVTTSNTSGTVDRDEGRGAVIALESDGKILVGGTIRNATTLNGTSRVNMPFVARLTAAGVLDNTFGETSGAAKSGIKRVAGNSGFGFSIKRIFESAQKIYALTDQNLYRLSFTDGTIDTSFAADNSNAYNANNTQTSDVSQWQGAYLLDATNALLLGGVDAGCVNNPVCSNGGAARTSPNQATATKIVLVTPQVADTTPDDPFAFTNKTNQAQGVLVRSDAITIIGINAPAAISVSPNTAYSIGCTASTPVDDASFTSSNGTITNNQTVCVRVTTTTSPGTASSTTLTVGTRSAGFTATTSGAAADTTPDTTVGTFTSVANAALNTVTTSNSITVTGVNAPTPISISGGTSPAYSIGCNGTFTSTAGTIRNNESVCVRVTSSGAANTATTTTLTVGSTPNPITRDFMVTTGSGPVINPAQLDFGSQSQTGSGAQKTLTLTNNGTGAMSLSGITVSGGNTTDFTQTNNCPAPSVAPITGTIIPASIAAGASCTITVTFKPTATGNRSSAVTINSSPATAPSSVPLTGSNSATGQLVFNPSTTQDFGSQAKGTTSATKSVMLTNTGNASVTITSVLLSNGEFAKTAGCTAATALAPNASCTFDVSFIPAGGGARTGSINVIDSASSNPSLSLKGNGLVPIVALAPNLTFAGQNIGTTSTAQTVVLSNNGDITLTSIAVTTTGDFAISNNACATTLAAGARCNVSVTFTPTISGSRTGTLNVTSNADSSPDTITLTGTGNPPPTPTADLSPTTKNFGDVVVNASSTQDIALKNQGTAPLTISTITFTGTNPSDYSQTNTCGTLPASLAAGAQCTITVTFRPTVVRSSSASLSVSSNAPSSPSTASLTGNGIASGSAAAVSLSTNQLTFTSQALQTTSAAQTVTLTNSGSASLTINSITVSGDFNKANSSTCASTLAVGANCAVNVTFSPTAVGTRNGTLTFNTNAASSPNAVGLTGKGANSGATVSTPYGNVTLTTDQGTVAPPAVANTPDAARALPYSYPVGFLNFQVTGVTPGSAVHLTYTLPAGLIANTYVKCKGTVCAVNPTSNASADGKSITFTVIEGGSDDTDGAQNGTLVDPGAPAFIANTNSTATATTGSSSSGAMGWETLLLMGVPALLRSRRRKLH